MFDNAVNVNFSDLAVCNHCQIAVLIEKIQLSNGFLFKSLQFTFESLKRMAVQVSNYMVNNRNELVAQTNIMKIIKQKHYIFDLSKRCFTDLNHSEGQ